METNFRSSNHFILLFFLTMLTPYVSGHNSYHQEDNPKENSSIKSSSGGGKQEHLQSTHSEQKNINDMNEQIKNYREARKRDQNRKLLANSLPPKPKNRFKGGFETLQTIKEKEKQERKKKKNTTFLMNDFIKDMNTHQANMDKDLATMKEIVEKAKRENSAIIARTEEKTKEIEEVIANNEKRRVQFRNKMQALQESTSEIHQENSPSDVITSNVSMNHVLTNEETRSDNQDKQFPKKEIPPLNTEMAAIKNGNPKNIMQEDKVESKSSKEDLYSKPDENQDELVLDASDQYTIPLLPKKKEVLAKPTIQTINNHDDNLKNRPLPTVMNPQKQTDALIRKPTAVNTVIIVIAAGILSLFSSSWGIHNTIPQSPSY